MKAKLWEGREAAVRPNDVWAMDFVHDDLATGKKIRVITVVDTFSHYVPVLYPRFSYRAEDVVRALNCPNIGYPKAVNGRRYLLRHRDRRPIDPVMSSARPRPSGQKASALFRAYLNMRQNTTSPRYPKSHVRSWGVAVPK
ncbi:transposase [Mesorhizobium sp. M1A.F.Ca.ET.072.01.1.1]|nr:transposase [Mesorhizobium sp. M1A.F.Ca.ET.072.01.1.1]TIV03669.1 MAG: transposase family protein [Mesorhizobium sp.]